MDLIKQKIIKKLFTNETNWNETKIYIYRRKKGGKKWNYPLGITNDVGQSHF